MHTEQTTYHLLPSSISYGTIEARHPIYGEARELVDHFGPVPGQYTQEIIGTEIAHLHFRISPDGALAIDSEDTTAPGWHQVCTLAAGATPEDVLTWVQGREFLGRRFWRTPK